MAKTPEELLALRIGGTAVADNLRRAIDSGTLIENEDGTLQLAKPMPSTGNWAEISHGPKLECVFLMQFMFRQAYANAAVPQGCSACYKVKAIPRTMRELVAAWGIAKRIECRSKWGVDLHNRFSQNIYAGYFYANGVEMARAIYRVAREAFDNDAKLGPGVALHIKRGCSEYEVTLGPSDRYEFAPGMAELEAYLKTRFRAHKRTGLRPVPMAAWIETAFRIGDDTYLDFTGGRRLHPKTLSYAP